MRSLHLCLDIVMLALLLRLALATIRNSREIIITDAVGAPCPSSLPCPPCQLQLETHTAATGGDPSAARMPN